MREIRKLGRGGFAKVTEVATRSGGRCAKKTFDPMEELINAVGLEHLEKRFKREVQYQSKFSHPNIVPITESFLDETPPYFLMPLAECTLKDELESDPSLAGRYKEVLFDVLAGLEYLHESGYVHRDLKPGNILKFPNGKHRYAISDYGLIAATSTDASTLTGENAQGGTQNYAAPELTRDFRAATAQADIYSFGAILHDMFGKGVPRIPYAELSLPGRIGKVIEKCTKKNAARRYRSISALRDDLSQALNYDDVEFSSSDEEKIVELLKDNTDMNADQWDELFFYLQGLDVSMTDAHNIFAALSLDHIDQLANDSSELLHALGSYFVDYVRHGSFDFDYCDVLASKAERLHDHGDLGLKASIILALLQLGVSHNRWYVERKFLNLCGPDISENLAKRIVAEIEVLDMDFTGFIEQLGTLVDEDRQQLHSILKNHIDNEQS